MMISVEKLFTNAAITKNYAYGEKQVIDPQRTIEAKKNYQISTL